MRVTAETKNATRKQILKVAQKQFAKQGFDATTTRDIARDAEYCRRHALQLFPDQRVDRRLPGQRRLHSRRGSFWGRIDPQRRQRIPRRTMRVTQLAKQPSLEEDLFAHIAAILRKLKPYRKYLPAVLETSLSPLAARSGGRQAVAARRSFGNCRPDRIAARAARGHCPRSPFNCTGRFTPVCWRSGRRTASPEQEDTLALLDQSLAMFVGWLTRLKPIRTGRAPSPKVTSGNER